MGIFNSLTFHNYFSNKLLYIGRIQRETRGSEPPGKYQVAICFLRSTGTDPLEKQLDPLGADPLENHKWLHVYVSLQVLVRTPQEKQLDP